MRILLTHGYFLDEDLQEKRIMKPYPPLGLLFLAAWLNKEGIPNEVYDTTFGNIESLKGKLEQFKPEIIGIYSTLVTKRNVLRIISFIKGNPSLQQTKIIIGGPDVRANAENYLNHGVDLLIPGEGEKPLTGAIRNFESGNINGLSGIEGILFKNKDGVLIQTTDPKQIDPVDLPFPFRKSINLSPYLDNWIDAHGYSSLNINTMRGCPFSCNWCSKAIYRNTYRRRSPEIVVEEMLQLRDHYNPGQIWFTDDVFTISREWLRDFNLELRSRDALMPYECISRSDCLDDEILDLLKVSGCKKLWIGAESGSQKVIDLMNRRINIESTIRIIKQAKRKGIIIGTFIMLGYPGEQKSDIMKTSAFLKKASPDELTIGLAYPIKGTKFYEQAASDFIEAFDWENSNEREIIFRKPYSKRFYRFAIRYLFNSYNALHTKKLINCVIIKFKALLAKGYICLFN